MSAPPGHPVKRRQCAKYTQHQADRQHEYQNDERLAWWIACTEGCTTVAAAVVLELRAYYEQATKEVRRTSDYETTYKQRDEPATLWRFTARHLSQPALLANGPRLSEHLAV